jgi:hypothetical protein
MMPVGNCDQALHVCEALPKAANAGASVALLRRSVALNQARLRWQIA